MGYQLVSHLPGVVNNRCLFYLDGDSPTLPPITDKTTIAPGSIAEDKSRAVTYYLASNYQWYQCNTAGGVLPVITGGPGYTFIGYIEGISANIKEYFIDNATDLATIMQMDYIDPGSSVMLITNGVRYRKETDGDWYIDISNTSSGSGGGGSGSSYSWTTDGSKLLSGLTKQGGVQDQQMVKFKLGGYTSSKSKLADTMTFEEALQALEAALVDPSPTPPESPQTGDMYYDTTLKQIMAYDGAKWVAASTPVASTTTPTDPTPGQQYYNTTEHKYYYYNENTQTWEPLGDKTMNTRTVTVTKTPVAGASESTITIMATDLGLTDLSKVSGFAQISCADATTGQVFLPDSIDFSVKSTTTLCKIVGSLSMPTSVKVTISVGLDN